jgi:hypothetical protein
MEARTSGSAPSIQRGELLNLGAELVGDLAPLRRRRGQWRARREQDGPSRCSDRDDALKVRAMKVAERR